MSYLNHIAVKLKYNPKLSIFLDVLSKAGISIQPFYVFLEDISQPIPPKYKNRLSEYDVCHLTYADMDAVAANPIRKVDKAELTSRLDKGNICLGAKWHNEIVSFIWSDLKECTYKGFRFILEENEAYIFDAFTDMSFRGKELAVLMRYMMYSELKGLNKRTAYSVSNRLYIPANRFKQKLNARIIDSGIFINIFGIWHSNNDVKPAQLKHIRNVT